jgi:hypothetical protein
MFRFLLLPLFSSLALFAESQAYIDTARLIQLSGVVVAEEDLTQIPYATVYDRTIRRGVISDYYGFFSKVVLPGDTLIFSAYGYKTSTYVVPDSLKDDRYSIIHMMHKDTLNLPEVTVYPWPSKEDFARYFVNMQPYEDAIRRAQRELSGESLAFVAARLEGDASLASGYAMDQRNTKIYTNGQLPVNNLLNPYSWAKLIDDWKAGKLSRQ